MHLGAPNFKVVMAVIGDAAWRKRESVRKKKEWFVQSLLLLAVLITIGCFVFNISQNLQARNIHSGFGFLSERAGFEIGESLIYFDSTMSFFRAFFVGFLNTVKVSFISIITATILGVIIGLMRLSKHPILRFLGAAHVEFYRNIPLLVQLLLIYLLITELLPMSMEAIHFGKWAMLSKAGLNFSVPEMNGVALGASLIISIISFILARSYFLQTCTGLVATIFSGCVATAAAFLVWVGFGFCKGWSHPVLEGFAIEGGAYVSPEFLALSLGLTFFTSASIAEIVRAGIVAVPQAQWSASYSLGLTTIETISYVIFPQALRLAIPPLSSQYMNLTKNSSLAVVVGYPDLLAIGNSTINLNGQALEVIVIVMVVFMVLNILTSLFMNWINSKVTRGTR